MAVLNPSKYYKVDELRTELKVGKRTLGNAMASGELRFSRQGQERFIYGQWVLDWIAKGVSKQPHKPNA